MNDITLIIKDELNNFLGENPSEETKKIMVQKIKDTLLKHANFIKSVKIDGQELIPHHHFLQDDANQYDSITSTTHNDTDVEFPEGWGDNLLGNFDGSYWANQFKILLDLKPEWAKDESYLTGWFANAIMTGYDKAKQEEFPTTERGPEDYVYVEFYDVISSELTLPQEEFSEFTFKFHTFAAAKEFVKLNAFGKNFKSKYYRYYYLEPTTTLKKMEIK